MKVLIATGLYPPDIGGPATYSKLLFDELPKKGIDVEVLSFREVRHLPYIIRHIAYFFKVLKKSKDVDVVYAQDPLGAGIPAGFAAKLRRKKFFLKVVGDRAWETGMQKGWTKKKLDEFSSTWITNPILFPVKVGQTLVAWMADKIITPSKYLRWVVSNWGVNKKKIQVINNAFVVPNIVASKEEARQKFSLSGVVLVSAGRLVPWKGFDTLIDIVPSLLKSIPDLKLFIIGSGPEEETLRIQIEKLKLKEKIFLTGQLPHEDLLEYLRAGDFFVLNTSYEGLSHQLLEAMAIGIPVVTTDVGGNPETIHSGREGVLVEYNNKEEIGKSIIDLYKNKEKREKIVKNAKEKIKMFDKERMLNELTKALREA